MELLRNSGVYAIKNMITNELYIGSSTNFGSRRDKHLSLLKHNKHLNHKLQESANRYGVNNFQFIVLEFCELNLKEREQHFVDLLNPVFNITIEVIRNTPSESSRRRMSNTRLRMYKEGLIKPNCSKEVVSINIQTGEVVVYPTIKAMYSTLRMDRSAVRRTLKGIYKQMKGYKLYYKQEYEDLVKLDELLETPEEDNQQPS